MTTNAASPQTHTPAPTPQWAQDILLFWFAELKPEDWFTGGARVDDLIRNHFGALFETMANGVPNGALNHPRIALASILLFDQFPRNLFRGTARAFATDNLALAIARNALDRDFDRAMERHERPFLYLPFEHSEVLADGERCVALFKSLGDEAGLAYAIEHRDILARFGRYPHRNAVLGRPSTPEEEAFLDAHKGFGQ